MGQNKLTILFEWQIGFLIKFDADFFTIELPLISIWFGLDKYARGVEIFGRYFNLNQK